MAAYIKLIAPKALVTDGISQISPEESIQSNEVQLYSSAIDIFSHHYYWGVPDIPSLSKHSEYVAGKGKVFMIGEFGLCNIECITEFLKVVNEKKTISGALLWSLRYHSRDGGFYTHQDAQYFSYHVPGFRPTTGFGKDEVEVVGLIRKNAILIQGQAVDAHLAPPAPQAILDPSINPTALRWMGSAWANRYVISRRNNESDPWVVMHYNVPDGLPSGRILYADKTVLAGQTYTYKVQPVSIENRMDPDNALFLGPFRVNGILTADSP